MLTIAFGFPERLKGLPFVAREQLQDISALLRSIERLGAQNEQLTKSLASKKKFLEAKTLKNERPLAGWLCWSFGQGWNIQSFRSCFCSF